MKKTKYILVIVALILIVFMPTAFISETDNGDSFTLGEDLTVQKDEVIDGSTAVLFGDAVIDGTINGELAVIFGDVTVNGKIDGNVASIFGSIRVGENGEIQGSAAAIMGEVKKDSTALIKGEVVSIKGPFNISGIKLMPSITIFSIASLTIFFGLSCLLLALMPERMNFMVENVQHKIGRRFGIGIVAYILFVPAIVALAISIIGLLLIPFFIPAFLLTAFIGMTAIKVAIGKRISGSIEGNGAVYIYLLIGAILIFVLPYIPVLGWLIYIAASCIGLGVVLDTRFGKPRTNL